MKQILLTFAAAFILSVSANAIPITDPFFMPAKAAIVADSGLGFSNNDLIMGKSIGLYQGFSYGISDVFTVGLGLGYAHIHQGGTGLTDPYLNLRYRVLDEASGPYLLDFKAYISPEVFDSPYNNDGGAGQGSTHIGAQSLIGTTQLLDGFTLGGAVKLEHIGSSDLIPDGTLLGLKAFAKYYLTDLDSLELGLKLNKYIGFEHNLNGYGFSFNYARDIIAQKFAAVPYIDIERHNKNVASSVNYGINLRYIF